MLLWFFFLFFTLSSGTRWPEGLGWLFSVLCIRLEPAGAEHFPSPDPSGSDKTRAGEALFKRCLLRAGLVKRSRKFWWISKWFLFPDPCQKLQGIFSGLHWKNLWGSWRQKAQSQGPSEIVISEICPLSPAVRQLQFKLPHRYWFPRRFLRRFLLVDVCSGES